MTRARTVGTFDAEDRLRFEGFLADTAARFSAALLPANIDQAVERALRELLGLLGADRCALIGGVPGEKLSWITCAVHSGTGSPDDPFRALDFATAFPWHYAQLCAASGPARIVQLADLPPEAEQDRRSAAEMGVGAMITVAMHGDEGSGHCLMVQSVCSDRIWPMPFVARLPLLTRILVNVLDRQRIEETRLVEPRHADVLESVGAIVWRADARTFQTTFVSREAETILGYPLESWVRVRGFWRDHVHPDDRAWVEAYSARAVREHRNHDFEYRMVVADGRTVWLRNIVKVIVAGGEPAALIGVTVDITQRKRAEFEAAQLRHQLAHAGRVTMLGQLAATLAHELNQPLGSMMSNAETARLLLDREPPALDDLRGIVDDIARDAGRAGDIVHRVRLLLQKRPLDMQPVDLVSLVHAVAGLARPLALARQIDLRIDLEPRLPSCVDAVQIQQVLLNLIVNAVDAVGDQPVDARHIVVRGVQRGPQVEVSVADTGCGIPADVLPRVFEPFFTTRTDGLGMGLPICRTIVEAHGGHIEVENNPAGGATVRITLPASDVRGE